jgi:hypothetical protein
MPHPADPADHPTGPALADHATHDAVLVATYAAGDAEGAELEAATALVAACAACAVLHRDLRAIAAAMPEVPAPARSRDFRLTPGQAASLRPAGWRRVLAPFAGPRFAFAAPLGSALAALGIVGILVAGTGLPLGGATAGVAPAEPPVAAVAPTAEDGNVNMSAATAAPAPVAQAPAMGPEASAAPAPSEGNAGAAAPVAGAATAGADKSAASSAPAASPGSVPGAPAGGGPAEAPEASGEAARTMGTRDQAAADAGNVVLLEAAAAMLLAGVVLAGLRVLSRRVA